MLEVYMGMRHSISYSLTVDQSIIDDIRKHQYLITREVTAHMSQYEVGKQCSQSRYETLLLTDSKATLGPRDHIETRAPSGGMV
jgi:hypothetical protein